MKELSSIHFATIRPLDFGSEASNYFTIGFLAARGNVTIQTTDVKESETRDAYASMTGRSLQAGELNVVPNINPLTGGVNKYGDEWRIFFPKPSQQTYDNLTLPADIDIKIAGKSQLSVNNNNYVKHLIATFGFLVGRNHDNIGNIRSNVPVQFQKDFDEGVAAT
jgi:hypothetical protein